MTSALVDEEAEIRSLWDKNAKSWVRGVRRGYDRFRLAFHDPVFHELLGDISGLSVVDLGCGEGVTCRALLERGARSVTGVDISPVMIEAARSEQSSGSAPIDYVVSSFSDAPMLQSESFDRAVSVMALMDLPNVRGAMQTAKRVVKRGGAFVFTVTHPIWDRRHTEWELSSSGIWQLKPGDYFDKTPWVDCWSFSRPNGTAAQNEPFEIRCYPRTIADYLNAAVDAGLKVERLAEPQAPSTADPELKTVFERWRRVPFYLMVRLRA